VPVDSCSHDRLFQHVALIVSDMDRAYQWLQQHRVEHASSGPQRLPDWNPKAGGIRAFYFKDPDGHALEILQFPAGKADPEWQQATDRLFLGIDHTAMVVCDTSASLIFYRDTLGLAVVGDRENYGTEQDHLNNVFGARMRITTLRAAHGPGIELLECPAPRDGRPIPADVGASDLLHRQTLLTRGIGSLTNQPQTGTFSLVSPSVVILAKGQLACTAGLLVRDPNGHAMQMI